MTYIPVYKLRLHAFQCYLVSARCGILDMDDLYILSTVRLVMLDHHLYSILLSSTALDFK